MAKRMIDALLLASLLAALSIRCVTSPFRRIGIGRVGFAFMW